MSAAFLPLADVEPNVENQRYWDALREGRIELPFCTACNGFVWYPRAICPTCHAAVDQWKILPGTGTVYSYSVVAKGTGRWRDAGPYVVAYVQLDAGIAGVDGPRILTNVVGDGAQQKIKIDARVRAIVDRDTKHDANNESVERVLLRFVVE